MKLKSTFKKMLMNFSGYWFGKRKNLFTGLDLFYDIHRTSTHDFQIIFDIGANTGQSVDLFKEHYKNAKIYSFEPINSIFSKLKKHTSKYRNVYLENIALGEVKEQKKVKLYQDVDHFSTLNSLDPLLMNNKKNAEEQLVNIITLDEYVRENRIQGIDLLKLDVEKWEMSVLKGAVTNLKKGNIKFILCEVGFEESNNRHTCFIQVYEYLKNFNYAFIGLYEVRLFQKKANFGNALFKYDPT